MRYLIALLIVCAMAPFSVVCAQTRTTPVEVENSPVVKIDASQNGVKAEQSGAWTVGIGGTPSVSVVNTPTVGISSAANVVSTPTVSSGVKLFTTTNPVIPSPGQLSSVYFTCMGYREVRVVVKFSMSGSASLLKIFPEYSQTPGGGVFTPGYVTCDTPSDPIVKHANFVQSGGVCVFTLPVLSTSMYLLFQNESGSNVTIDSDRTWVWLVN